MTTLNSARRAGLAPSRWSFAAPVRIWTFKEEWTFCCVHRDRTSACTFLALSPRVVALREHRVGAPRQNADSRSESEDTVIGSCLLTTP
jgi:hypothetical protein